MDSILSGGSDGIPAPVLGDDSRLEQPVDAVPMEQMSSTIADRQHVAAEPSSTLRDVPADADRTRTDTTTTTSPDSDANTHANTDADADADADAKDQAMVKVVVSKGKEKEEAPPPPLTKECSSSVVAIGPTQDDIATAPAHSDGPVCNITLLLTSGSRHPYKIDAKYLARRKIAMPDETEAGQPDPFSISIYTLKELILREWRSDWEAKPASPSSIRLIHFGKLLDDKEQLRKYQFSTESPNVVHMSIRPQDLDEEEPKSGSKSLPAGSGESHRSRSNGMCCVIL